MDLKSFENKKHGLHCWRHWPAYLLLVTLCSLLIIVFFKWWGLEWLIDLQVVKQIRLIPETDAWKNWLNIPTPLLIKFTFFNVTNPIEIMNGGKPQLAEIGPFVFEERRSKNVVLLDIESESVTYKETKFYHFRPDLSSALDHVIIINVPFVTTTKLMESLTNLTLVHGFMDRTLNQFGERLFKYASVKDLLFEGVSVQSYVDFLSNPLLQFIGTVRVPSAFSGDKFGFMKGKNGSEEGKFVVRTGESNFKEVGSIVSWNGRTSLDYWTGSCNLIKGTDGLIFHPFITKNDILRIYSPDFCRTTILRYGSDIEYQGIKGYRFRTPKSTPNSGSDKDFCFCPRTPEYQCLKEGSMNLASCREGTPLSVSSPHFSNAHESYLKGVEGLSPVKEKHETFIDVEPKTGLVLRAARRFQLNVQLESNQNMPTFIRVQNATFPIYWVEEIYEMDETQIRDIKIQLVDDVELIDNILLFAIGVCSILIALGVTGCALGKCQLMKQRHAVQNPEKSLKASTVSTNLSSPQSTLGRSSRSSWNTTSSSSSSSSSSSDSESSIGSSVRSESKESVNDVNVPSPPPMPPESKDKDKVKLTKTYNSCVSELQKVLSSTQSV